MCVYKRICRTWNLELNSYVLFLKKTLNYIKIEEEIADGNCGYSALGLLHAGIQNEHRIVVLLP